MARAEADTRVKSGIVGVNGADLYYELRGDGEAVLFIAGATGDAGHFANVADVLAEEFTVATYDRRGNSRSAGPAGWTATSTDEQSDDAAALIEALGIEPAFVVGASGGGIIALNLVIRHADKIRGAVLHEPPLISVLERPEETMAILEPIVEGGMARGGPRGAVEAFLGFAAGESLTALDADTRERMLGNGETLFGLEFGKFESYRPDDDTLASVSVPVHVVAGRDTAPPFKEPAGWLAARLGTSVRESPDAHTPYFDRPAEFAETIRALLRRMT